MVTFSVKAWWTPKGGYTVAEYEDAYRISEPTDTEPLRVAVADGATGATFSALWAGLLSADCASGQLTPETLPQRVPVLAREWTARVQSEPLPWYAQAKVSSEGSHAALLGLSLSPETGDYKVFAVGDCALFHIRPTNVSTNTYKLVSAFPYARWNDFSGTPVLIGTKSTTQANINSHLVVQQGTVKPGDALYAMSDALAAWFLRETEKERAPWSWFAPLDQPSGDATLSSMIRELRDSKRLKNDDVTVVRIQVSV